MITTKYLPATKALMSWRLVGVARQNRRVGGARRQLRRRPCRFELHEARQVTSSFLYIFVPPLCCRVLQVKHYAVVCCRYKARFVEVWNELCKMKGCTSKTGRPVERKFTYQGLPNFSDNNTKFKKISFFKYFRKLVYSKIISVLFRNALSRH